MAGIARFPDESGEPLLDAQSFGGSKGHSHKIGASIGAALIPDDGSDAEEIIHHADLAMYRAKGQDGSSVVFFEPKETGPKQTDGLVASSASRRSNER